MSTFRYAIYSVLEGLKSAFPDADLDESMAFYWFATTSNLFRKRHLQSTPTGAYLTKFTGVPVLYDGARQYIELPAAIYDYTMEKGISYMSYDRPVNVPPVFTQTFFEFVQAAEIHRLYYSPYERPSPKNPYAYRMKDKLYLLGTEHVSLKTLEIALYAAIDPRITMNNLDDDCGLNEEQISQVTLEVLNLGRWTLSIPSYRAETGTDGRSMPGTNQMLKSGAAPSQEEQQESQNNQ
jgi:hypothetical protein